MNRALDSLFAVLFLALVGASCASSTKGSTGPAGDTAADPVWLEPSPALERDINVHALEVEVITTYDDFVRLSDWFQGAGEPAYPKLLEMASGSKPKSRSFAFSVISALGDPRLLAPLRREVDFDDLSGKDQRYEYARALLSMHDFDGIPVLIEALADPSVEKRALAYRALARSTNNGLRFDVNAPDDERAAMVDEWRAWWEEVSGDQMLSR